MATYLRAAGRLEETSPERDRELGRLRVLIAHDWLVTWAGSERCVAEMLEIFPSADLVVGVISASMRNANAVARRARETWLGRVPGARRHHRWFVPLEGVAFASVDTRDYDLVLSSSHAFSKMIRTAEGTHHACYCYSPPRYLWDLQATYNKQASRLESLALKAATSPLRWLDRRAAAGVDHFIGISAYIAERIGRVYGRQADVVYPPVTPKPGHCLNTPRERFLLHLGRLVPYKQVDIAIRAAESLGLRLVVAGDGPERAKLEKLAGPRTEFLGAVSESEAARLLSRCAAFVFCAEEDFGIAPVEANAHGAPVVALGRGGLLETMVSGVTAEFFDEATVEKAAEAIQRAIQRKWNTEALRANAARFSPENFRRALASSLSAAIC